MDSHLEKAHRQGRGEMKYEVYQKIEDLKMETLHIENQAVKELQLEILGKLELQIQKL